MKPGRFDILKMQNVRVLGRGTRVIMFAHGFGCDQTVWKAITPAFEDAFKVVLFDHVGAGASDIAAFDRARHSDLNGYAADVIAIGDALGLNDVVFVGHSVSAMIGILSAVRRPDLFSRLVLIGPSPRYLDDGDYRGGFDAATLHELLDFMDSNYLGWSSAMAPAIMGNPDRPELAAGLTESFCRADPEIAKHFARVTFFSDNRADLPLLTVPSLILQCSSDVIAPEFVGAYMHEHLRESRLVRLAATGHCPHVSHPAEVVGAMKGYLQPPVAVDDHVFA